MAFNRIKAQEAALKYLQQGKVAQAIVEYQDILRREPKDQATLMTIGDLFVRQGDARQATAYFERLAEIFQHNGFNSKAIAIFKKIAKLAPSETMPLERLADLYVQQGVLSEARPLFLQLAETHLKAGHKQQAIESLRKLLEVEPDNLRVQTRLTELYVAIGQKREAALTCLNFARRTMERGEMAEALKQLDHALLADPGFVPALLLKAQALAAAGKPGAAIELVEKLPDAAEGGETTSLLIDLSLKAGQTSRAVELSRKAFTRKKENHMLIHGVAAALLEAGEADVAFELLGEIRETMIEAGEQEPLSQALTSAAEHLPGRLEPLEWLVDLRRRTSDSFRLPAALAQLAEAYAAADKLDRAEALYQELLEREPDNEALLQQRNRLREKLGLELVATAAETGPRVGPAPAQPVAVTEPALDEVTERYVTQALTDVDLFSSYGLPQKAIQLLENVRQRAPQHTPALERLLDLYLGAGNNRRTAELASQLEHLHHNRGNLAAAERFSELRRRFQRAAGMGDEEMPAAPAAAPTEFPVGASAVPASPPVIPSMPPPAAAPPSLRAEAPAQELDLSDEWAALAQEVSGKTVAAEPPLSSPDGAPPSAEPPPRAAEEEAPEFDLELVPTTPAAWNAERAAMTQQDFLNSLVAEVEELEPLPAAAEPPPGGAAASQAAAPQSSDTGNVDQLREVFQDFRSELGEMGEEDEDLETHYNLGIAYREMGLLDEAIGEFQKVAKAVQAGRPFRYAMQCSTLLALTFTAKGEPKIAALWYQRALETPNLDQESVLALRYDLGLALELAGDAPAALESFRQVYAMNIDYRDVAERIAALQKN